MLSLTFMGLSNAFGMVSPVRTALDWLRMVGIQSEAVRLFVIFGVSGVVFPMLSMLTAAWLSQRLSKADRRESLRTYASRYAPAFVPVGFGIWLAHYGFHLAISGLTIIPALQSFLLRHGSALLGGGAQWELSYLLPASWIFPLQVVAVLGGFGISLSVLARAAMRREVEPIQSLLELLPWAALLMLIVLAALAIFNLPMEMRGMMMET
jgi:hypothetical protein